VVSQLAKKRSKGGNQQLRTPRTELASLAPNEVRDIPSSKLRKLAGILLESCREELINEWHIV